MGYVSDFSAPRRWICGWIFIDKARKSLKEVYETEYEDITINTLAQIFLVHIDIIRGIRTVLLLPPDNDNLYIEEIVLELKSKLPKNLFDNIFSSMFKFKTISFFGEAQYGVHNYVLQDKSGHTERLAVSPTQKGKDMLWQAIKEWTNSAESLLDVAKEVFWQEYLKDREDDILSGDPECITICDSEVIEELIDLGYANNEKEAIEIYKKYDSDPCTLCDSGEIKGLYFCKTVDQYLESFKEEIYEELWDSGENEVNIIVERGFSFSVNDT